MTLFFCMGVSRPGSRAGKTPPSEDLNQATLHPTEFPVQMHQQLGSADEQSHWLELILGSTGRSLVCHNLSAN